ncbi:helix-turn-helix domain-containing protein [Paenibacillus sp.]|uniref:helix-turn-helix domain-containing protein n=1 Tax=Paenibacillus sp. TaxID=58172 RepID=UPI002D2724D7|nr:helix-turn-helix domain-containing protein [Paenibacillus sp.]HZG85397.1 helix-turn-helix domain-containing protein [Paenibacillus sp.]
MKMNWYYRMILSYAPILFVIISSMIFSFFLVLNHASEKKYIETNQAILDRMVFHADANLMLIERNVVSKLLMDTVIQDYFSDRPKGAFEEFVLQKKLIELNSTLPFANTIYVYHEAEQLIISDVGSYKPDGFGDYAFLMRNYSREETGSWHDPREFAYASSDPQKQQVISLVKLYRNGDETLGAIVVNVFQQSLLDYLNSFNGSDSTSIRLVGGDADAALSVASSETKSDTITVQSEYTGWRFVSEGVYDRGYATLSLFSSAWMILLIVVIVLALIGFTVVTHIHYRPIQSIMEKVGQYSNRKSEALGMKGANNEFAFIETALDQLLKRSMDYESLHKEDSLLRQQLLFHELLMGHRRLSDEQFRRRLAELSLPTAYDRLGVIAVEIDYYAAFTEKYKLRDQHLIKFVIESAFRELGQTNDTFVWHAWIEPHRIAFVTHHTRSRPRSEKPIQDFAEEFHRWIDQNLELTVTVGVGSDSQSIESIAESYRTAQDNLALKTVFGTNTIIDNRRSAAKLSLDNYAYLQAIDNAAQSFRMNESDWREKLTRIFGELKRMRFAKQDMIGFTNSFVLQMDKAITALSPNIQEIWRNDYQQRFAELTEKAETLDELEERLMSAMTAFEAAVDEDRKARRHHSLALQAKNYIDAHFADPDLSLSRVSEYLNLQPSALSQLFKEELGEKFIDYVLKVRLQHARKLLVETEDSIQSIAEQIGYQNVISFYRAFKKIQDIPPGEYRNMYRTNS